MSNDSSAEKRKEVYLPTAIEEIVSELIISKDCLKTVGEKLGAGDRAEMFQVYEKIGELRYAEGKLNSLKRKLGENLDARVDELLGLELSHYSSRLGEYFKQLEEAEVSIKYNNNPVTYGDCIEGKLLKALTEQSESKLTSEVRAGCKSDELNIALEQFKNILQKYNPQCEVVPIEKKEETIKIEKPETEEGEGKISKWKIYANNLLKGITDLSKKKYVRIGRVCVLGSMLAVLGIYYLYNKKVNDYLNEWNQHFVSRIELCKPRFSDKCDNINIPPSTDLTYENVLEANRRIGELFLGEVRTAEKIVEDKEAKLKEVSK